MALASQLSPDLARDLLQLARALVGAARHWALYPPEHPAVGQSLVRLGNAVRVAANGAIFVIGVTPETLLIEGVSADRGQLTIAEAATLLHDRDILELAFIGDVPHDALRSLLKVLALEAADLRQRGGPAQIWAADGHPSIAIQQVDYLRVLERERGETPEAARRDDVWRSIVLSIAVGQSLAMDQRVQQRLVAVAGSPSDIRDLATAVLAPKCTMDGSPMITSQAATVLAAFRYLSNIVSVVSPDRVPDVMRNIATAAAQLDPHVVMEVLRTEEGPADQLGVVRGMSAAFDDVKVAQLLATALALDGRASDRLATIFNTIAPDRERKHRVLTLARTLLSETDFGRSGQFQTLWTSMEELLISYDDKPFMSESYRGALDGLGERAGRMALADLPPELPQWMESLGQDNVRTLSVTLLVDLLTIELDAARAADIARDMEAAAEDLLMSGAYADAKSVAAALSTRAALVGAIGRDACRLALYDLAESGAMRETAALIGDVEEEDWSAIRDLMALVGAGCVEALKALVMVEQETRASRRGADLICGFGPAAIPHLGTLVADSRWFVQRAGARLLGRIPAAEAVPLLHPLLRKTDPRVAREAIVALTKIDDPSAARAVHMVLRTATGELRRLVVETLVADRDPRVAPMLARIVAESNPLGADHDIVLETLAALGLIGTDEGIQVLAGAIRRRSFFRRRRLRALKEQGVAALRSIGTPKASAAIEEGARTGDRMLRRVIAARRQT